MAPLAWCFRGVLLGTRFSYEMLQGLNSAPDSLFLTDILNAFTFELRVFAWFEPAAETITYIKTRRGNCHGEKLFKKHKNILA